MASASDVRAGRAFVELYVRDHLTKGLRAAQAQLQKFSADMMAVGQRLMQFSALAALPLAASVKTFASFSDAMLMVKAVTGASAEEFDTLNETAKRLGATTSFTAIQVAGLMTELGRAGFNPGQINEMTAAVLDLARASGTDATLASGIMAATIRQFGLEATDATRVADVLAATANKTFNTVEQLGEAFSYAGPVAADFGLSLEDTASVLGVLGNVGIQASNAGTALRRLLTLSGSESGKLKEIFGVDSVDAAGDMRPIVDVLEDIGKATEGMGTATRGAKFNEFFGLLGITGASALTKNIGSIRELRAALGDASGTAERTAKEMDSGLGGAFRILWSAVEGVAISIGEALAPEVQRIAEAFTKWAEWVRLLINNNRQLVVAVGATVVGVGLLGGAMVTAGIAAGAVSLALGGAATVATALASAIAAVLSPMGLVTVAIAGAAAALLYFTGAGAAGIEFLSGKLKDLRDIAAPVFKGISDALAVGDLGAAAEIGMLAVEVAFRAGVHKVAAIMSDMADMIHKLPKAGMELLSATWEATLKRMSKSMDEMFLKLQITVIGSLQSLMSKIDKVLGKATGGSIFGDLFGGELKLLKNALDALGMAGPGKDPLSGLADMAAKFEATSLADLEESRAKLDAAIADAAAARASLGAGDESLFFDEAGAAPAAIAAAGGPPAVAEAAAAASRTFGTFSAAGALAQGAQTGGPIERVARGVEKMVKTTDEHLGETKKLKDFLSVA